MRIREKMRGSQVKKNFFQFFLFPFERFLSFFEFIEIRRLRQLRSSAVSINLRRERKRGKTGAEYRIRILIYKREIRIEE